MMNGQTIGIGNALERKCPRFVQVQGNQDGICYFDTNCWWKSRELIGQPPGLFSCSRLGLICSHLCDHKLTFHKFKSRLSELFTFSLQHFHLRLSCATLQKWRVSCQLNLCQECSSQVNTEAAEKSENRFHSSVRSCRKIQLRCLVPCIKFCGWTWRKRRWRRTSTCHDESSLFHAESWLSNKCFFVCFASGPTAQDALVYMNIRNPTNERFVYKIISSATGRFRLTNECGVIEPGAAAKLGSTCFHSISFRNFLIISLAFSFLQAWKLGLWRHVVSSFHGLVLASSGRCIHLRSAVGWQSTSLPINGGNRDDSPATRRWRRYLPIKRSNGTNVLLLDWFCHSRLHC